MSTWVRTSDFRVEKSFGCGISAVIYLGSSGKWRYRVVSSSKKSPVKKSGKKGFRTLERAKHWAEYRAAQAVDARTQRKATADAAFNSVLNL